MNHAHSLVIRPVISEKSMQLARGGWYTFAVRINARKEEIATIIGKLYEVTVVDVRTVRVPGKTRMAGRLRRKITRPDWKKTMVKLSKGQHIPVFEVSPEGASS